MTTSQIIHKKKVKNSTGEIVIRGKQWNFQNKVKNDQSSALNHPGRIFQH